MTALISKRVQIFGEGSRDQWETHGQGPFGVRDWISKDGRRGSTRESRFASPVSFFPEAPSPATVAIIQEGHSKRTCDHAGPDPSKRGEPFPTWIQGAGSLGHKIGGNVLTSPRLPSNGSWLMSELYSFQGHSRNTSPGGVVQDSGSSQRLSTYDNVPISPPPSLSTPHKSASVAWSTSSCETSATIDSVHSCAAYRATDSSAFSSLPVDWVTYNSLPYSEGSQCDSLERPEEPNSNHSDWSNLAGAPRDPADRSGDLKSLIAELKAELNKQRTEFEASVKRTEETSTELKKKVARLEEELDQERKKYMLLEIKLRNSERARKDAEKRNYLLQEEMETFFTTLRNLTVESQVANVPK